MKTAHKQISVSEFKAHCAEELRVVELGDTELEITRHGKVIAIVTSPARHEPDTDLMQIAGALRETVTFAEDYDPHSPAWEEDDWEMNRTDRNNAE